MENSDFRLTRDACGVSFAHGLRWRDSMDWERRDGGRGRDVAAMMAGSHAVVGLVAWAWAAPRLGLHAVDPVALGLSTLGALLPDIDHPKSWVGQRVWLISKPLSVLLSHRGLTHSLLAVGMCIVLLQAKAFWTPLAVGYLSHLAADLLTPRGLRLAWPLKRSYALPLYKTGGAMEPLLVGLLLLWTGMHLARLKAPWL